VVAGIAAGVLYVAVLSKPSYHLQIIFPDASNIVEGTSVLVNGAGAGSVEGMSVKDGKADVVVGIKPYFSPLHDGTTASIVYRALLGERMIDLHPGPRTAPPLASGSVIQGSDRVGLDQVLDALTPAVRQRLVQLVPQVQAVIGGRTGEVQATLASAGPAVKALGTVLSGIGADSVTLQQLVTTLDQVVHQADAQRAAVRQTVAGLTTAMQSLAGEESQLQGSVQQLPAVVQKATATFAALPPTSNDVVPLLQQLDPALDELPQVSSELRPVLDALEPVSAELPPVVESLGSVLDVTPSLLSNANAVIPGVSQALGELEPAIEFLRPYTPELVGWLENWGSACANYDSNGNYCRIWVTVGPENVNELPAVVPPFNTVDTHRPPGALADQPWTDAAGSPLS
jgi:phospholipid/cholesterol/gamma-HCH transport system substrate-binding protein